MNMSLDEIISSKPKSGRRSSNRRGGPRAQVLGNPTPAPAQKARAAPVIKAATSAAQTSSEKIVVSNLPQDVNEAQIKELFSTTVGVLREVTLHYDASGRSKGIATILFVKKGDGTKAFNQYNNRLIDGKRPMKIEIVVDPTRPVPLASRVAPAPAANGAQTQPARTGTASRGGRRGRGRGGARKSERPAKTAADLDAEMEDYTAANAPTAATA